MAHKPVNYNCLINGSGRNKIRWQLKNFSDLTFQLLLYINYHCNSFFCKVSQ